MMMLKQLLLPFNIKNNAPTVSYYLHYPFFIIKLYKYHIKQFSMWYSCTFYKSFFTLTLAHRASQNADGTVGITRLCYIYTLEMSQVESIMLWLTPNNFACHKDDSWVLKD